MIKPIDNIEKLTVGNLWGQISIPNLLEVYCAHHNTFACYMTAVVNLHNDDKGRCLNLDAEVDRIRKDIHLKNKRDERILASQIVVDDGAIVFFDTEEAMDNFYSRIDGDDTGGNIYAITVCPKRGTLNENT